MFKKVSLVGGVTVLAALSYFYWADSQEKIEAVTPAEQQFAREFGERKTWPMEKHESYWQSLKGETQFYVLGELVLKAHRAKDWERAEKYANQYLAQAQQFPESWNFGNAIFYAHMTLSEMFWAQGAQIKAKEHLIKASETPGSPQLISFGPFKEEIHRAYLRHLVSDENRAELLRFARNFKKVVAHKPWLSDKVEEEQRAIQVANEITNELDRFIADLEAKEFPKILELN